MKGKLIISITIAAVFWFIMFSPWTKELVNFWVTMTIAGISLTAISQLFGRDLLKQFQLNLTSVLIGLASAVVLYLVFFFGEFFSTLLFSFARPQVDLVYGIKESGNPILIAAALLFIIGPAEEVFWRGYVQRYFITLWGENKAFIFTTLIYALVHIWAFNFMLFMAALICGTFWGLMYRYNKNLVPLIISHAVWDVAIFILFPIH